MKMIKLNDKEFEYLVGFLPLKLRNILNNCVKNNDNWLLKISEENADIIRDACGEQLQLVGFDEKYTLTTEGKILESLIDKFFVNEP